MMMRALIAILFGGCLLAPSALAQEQHWTQYFIRDQVTPSDVKYTCKASLDQEAMKSHLREIGGPLEGFNPSINWAEDMTIIIFPNKVYTDFDLAFKDMVKEGDRFILRWGWWNSSQRRWMSSSPNTTSSTNTVGTGKKRQIIIVVVKRYLYKPTNRLYCREYEGR